MTSLSVYKPFDIKELASAAMPFVRRLLRESVDAEEPIPVDVHVRSYGDSLPLAQPMPTSRSHAGRLPVGTLLDCYL